MLYVGALLLCAVLIAGCTNPGTTTPAAGTNKTPSMIGNWSGTSAGYVTGIGLYDFANDTMVMQITKQQGRIFAGEFVYTNGSRTITSELGGVLNLDGTTFTIAEAHGGYSYGTITGPNACELVFIRDGEELEAAIDLLKRQ
jgi:hypothetical protein